MTRFDSAFHERSVIALDVPFDFTGLQLANDAAERHETPHAINSAILLP